MLRLTAPPTQPPSDLEGKYVDGKNGVALTQTWLTNNSLKTQLELEGHLAKGGCAGLVARFRSGHSDGAGYCNRD